MTSTPLPAASPTPFDGLVPETVLDALDSVGLRGDGRLIQLNSFENRVFQVFLEDGRVVVAKFYRPGRWSDAQILEEHAFAVELAEAEVPVAAPLPLAVASESPLAAQATAKGSTLVEYTTAGGASFRFGVALRFGGRAPELEDEDTLERIGRFIGRLHTIGAQRCFEHRLALTPDTFGTTHRDWLLAQQLIPPEAESAWRSTADRALIAVRDAFAQLGALRTLRLHGDCHLGNMLWSDATGPHFVDLDDAVMGPAVQDLWMLLAGDRPTARRQLAAVLEGYEAFREFDQRELRLIEPLRTLRMIHHSAWIARRWADPAFPIAFPWFESPAYWAEQTTRLREQLEAMAEPPLY
ncbi:MAG TPA: serine/threonine protein kinase [Burkholderiaceae bacterium]